MPAYQAAGSLVVFSDQGGQVGCDELAFFDDPAPTDGSVICFHRRTEYHSSQRVVQRAGVIQAVHVHGEKVGAFSGSQRA